MTRITGQGQPSPKASTYADMQEDSEATKASAKDSSEEASQQAERYHSETRYYREKAVEEKPRAI